MKILRVFPRKTSMTPNDDDVRINCLPTLMDEADEIHISVSFDWDMRVAEQLAGEWEYVAPVKIGGPATGERGDEFTPGMYVKDGNVITHRGCPNRCWFCDAWKREGNEVRLLKINDGWNLLDNNIFATSVEHQESVYSMLLRQDHRPRFTGGLEAARFTAYHAEWMVKLNPEYIYFAYDEPNDYDPLLCASKILNEYGLLKNHKSGCYVLIGYPRDTFEDAEKRLIDVIRLGLMPQAMLYDKGIHWPEEEMLKWRRFAREWANKVIVGVKMREYGVGGDSA